jgi:hypothetical protein
MSDKYEFTHQLPANSGRLIRAVFGIITLIIICAVGIILSNIFWDDYTEQAYSIKLQRNVTVGWPATVSGWGWWLGIGAIVISPMMFFMQDFKNPSLALTLDGLFINQQLIRNTFVPFANVDKVVKDGKGYRIFFKDNKQIIQQQVFLFKPFVKSNLSMGNFIISKMHSKGNIDEFMVELKKHIAS